jgi:protein-disulfide isomerase
MEQLRQDLELAEVRAKIMADQQGGIRAGVRSTPAMFINGRLVPNPQTPGMLIELVEEAAASG